MGHLNLWKNDKYKKTEEPEWFEMTENFLFILAFGHL